MNKKSTLLFLTAFFLIGGAALGMRQMKAHQRLGLPGIKTSPIAGSPRLDIYLPEKVLAYKSEVIPTDTNVLIGLPQDTSFMQRRYSADYEPMFLLNVVLMGSDRTSIHKPQFCLTGQGWNIDSGKSVEDSVRIESPNAYDLPVMKLISAREVNDKGKMRQLRGIFVYWFVADQELTSSHLVRMRKSATHLLTTGELERWAYVACFAVCLPEQEQEVYQRMKKFIAASVPEFQLTTNPHAANQESVRTASR